MKPKHGMEGTRPDQDVNSRPRNPHYPSDGEDLEM